MIKILIAILALWATPCISWDGYDFNNDYVSALQSQTAYPVTVVEMQ